MACSVTVGKKKKPIFQMDKTCRYYDIELYKDTSAVVKPFRIESEPKFDWEALAGRPHARMICCGVRNHQVGLFMPSWGDETCRFRLRTASLELC